jgi:N-acetylmuramic acid 6-phosphate etherase
VPAQVADLGVVDASECPPTYGVPYGLVIGVIAGGTKAITQAVEFAEDSPERGWLDMDSHMKSVPKDFVIGIAASGRTPYVIGALKRCKASKMEFLPEVFLVILVLLSVSMPIFL